MKIAAKNFGSAFEILSPVIFKHAFQASKVSGGSGESEESAGSEE